MATQFHTNSFLCLLFLLISIFVISQQGTTNNNGKCNEDIFLKCNDICYTVQEGLNNENSTFACKLGCMFHYFNHVLGSLNMSG